MGKYCWSQGGQHFCINKMHFIHWKKDIKNEKDSITNYHIPRILQSLFILQKPLKGTKISTTSINSNDAILFITPTILQSSLSTFSNEPLILHYSFHNYYQPTILLFTMLYIDNYYALFIMSSIKIYNTFFKEKIKAIRF